ncbi:MAG: hypothetical protein ACR5LD_09345 [Symbiopectobacterium sp.]
MNNMDYRGNNNVVQHSDKNQRIRQSTGLPERGTPMPLARLNVVLLANIYDSRP